MKINAIKCRKCKATIYSRARHDMRYCKCGAVFVDGGLDYFRFGGNIPDADFVILDLSVSKQALFKDWNEELGKFGIIYEKI